MKQKAAEAPFSVTIWPDVTMRTASQIRVIWAERKKKEWVWARVEGVCWGQIMEECRRSRPDSIVDLWRIFCTIFSPRRIKQRLQHWHTTLHDWSLFSLKQGPEGTMMCMCLKLLHVNVTVTVSNIHLDLIFQYLTEMIAGIRKSFERVFSKLFFNDQLILHKRNLC